MMKRILKRILSLSITLSLIIGFISFLPDFFMHTYASDGDDWYYYEVDENNNAIITKYECYYYPVTANVPAIINGHTVVEIADSAFKNTIVYKINLPNTIVRIGNDAFSGCSRMISISIPNSVTSIGDGAFSFCDFSSITIPDSVIHLGDDAFYGCQELKDITLSKNIKSIGEGAFAECLELTEFTVPDSVTVIGDWAFNNCKSLKRINLSENLTSIGAGAFCFCENLLEITIPKNVSFIGNGMDKAFSLCPKLRNIFVDGENETFGTSSGALYNKITGELMQYPAGNTRTNYSIPYYINEVSSEAFYGCSYLETVTFHDNVTTIGSRAFYNSSKLTTVKLGKGITAVGYDAFTGCNNLSQISIDPQNPKLYCDESGALFDKTTNELICYSLINKTAYIDVSNSYQIPDNITGIGYDAFTSYIKTLTIPHSITYINDNAFKKCSGLSYVYYDGTEDDWNEIIIGTGNDKLLNATIHFNHHLSYTPSVTKPETCTENGILTFMCACGHSYTEDIPATGHSYQSEIITNAECTSTGIKSYTCHCGDSYTEAIPATGHSYTSKTQNPTCTKDGLITYTCHCGDAYTETLPATGHSYTSKTQKPTCTKDGYIKYTCHCGNTYSEAIPATGHSYTSKTQNPTCTKDGYIKYTCHCGNTYSEAIPAKGHNAVTDKAIAPTCTETGFTEGSHCETCSVTLTAQQTVPAIGHSFGSWEYDSGSTYKRECVICDEAVESITIDLKLPGRVNIENQNSNILTAKAYYWKPIEPGCSAYTEVTNEFAYDVIFTSSNNDIVSVNSDGKIIAQKVGSATVTATINGTSISANCTVNVTPGQFTVTWIVDGVENVQTVNENAYIKKPANPYKDGYKFVGWTPEVPYNMPAHNLTFTAVFEKVYRYYCPYCELGFDISDEINAHIKIETEKRASITILSPSTTTINYGDRIILHAETGTIPNGAKIVWEMNNNNFSAVSSSYNNAFIISPKSSGKTTITAKIISSDGRVLCSDEQEMTSNAGFFQKIIAFFKNLFGMNKTIPQAFKGMF